MIDGHHLLPPDELRRRPELRSSELCDGRGQREALRGRRGFEALQIGEDGGRRHAPQISRRDAAWLEQRAPLLPLDHHDRSNLCASPGLTATPPPTGGEDVALPNLAPNGGSLSFGQPKVRIAARLEAKGKSRRR